VADSDPLVFGTVKLFSKGGEVVHVGGEEEYRRYAVQGDSSDQGIKGAAVPVKPGGTEKFPGFAGQGRSDGFDGQRLDNAMYSCGAWPAAKYLGERGRGGDNPPPSVTYLLSCHPCDGDAGGQPAETGAVEYEGPACLAGGVTASHAVSPASGHHVATSRLTSSGTGPCSAFISSSSSASCSCW
jgi:hypothetical protein